MKLPFFTAFGFWAVLVASQAFAQAPIQPAAQRDATVPVLECTPDSDISGPLGRLPIARETLDNGLRVVLSPNKTVPTVAIAIYYDVGSRNEAPGSSGYAHLFEHLMFQGSRNVGKMEHFQLVTKRGGEANGGTGSDYTGYYETLPSSELELGLWLEADRMRSLAITPDNFENQRKTVMEERRESYDNQPYMVSTLRINELAYGSYFPYAHSTIGDMKDLRHATLESVRAFFNTYYVPNNAVLVIVGDFDPQKAFGLIRRHFEDIAAGKTPEFKPSEFVPQTAERVEAMEDPLAELPAFHVAYHIVPDRHADHYPLDLLAIILGDGASSRLYQKLIKQREIVQQIRVDTDGRRGPDLLSVWAICAKGHTGVEAREAIFKEIEQVAARGVSARELQKAKNRVRSHFIFGLESNLSRAERLAEFELQWGDATLLRSELDRYLAVEIDEVKRVAVQYLTVANRTVLDVLPPAAAAPKQSVQVKKSKVRRSVSKRSLP
jgi:zinc protease